MKSILALVFLLPFLSVAQVKPTEAAVPIDVAVQRISPVVYPVNPLLPKLFVHSKFVASTPITSPFYNNNSFLVGPQNLELGATSDLNSEVSYAVSAGFGFFDRALESPLYQPLILDAYLKIRTKRSFTITFGRFYLPGSIERVSDFENNPFSNYNFANRNYQLGRDNGIQLEYALAPASLKLVAKFQAAVTTGDYLSTTNLGGFNYTGRVEVLPFGPFPYDYSKQGLLLNAYEAKELKAVIGASYNYNDNASYSMGNVGPITTVERDVTTFIADALVRYKKWAFTAEYFYKNAPIPVVYDTDFNVRGIYNVGEGINTSLGYTSAKQSLFARFTYVSPYAVTTFSKRYISELAYTYNVKNSNVLVGATAGIDFANNFSNTPQYLAGIFSIIKFKQ